MAFRDCLARSLEAFGHSVYWHEGDHQAKFTVRTGDGYPDLYMQTASTWRDHESFPVIGIETKIPRSLGWLIDAVGQIGRYTHMSQAEYYIAGVQVEAPALFLLATSDSWDTGDIYHWEPPQVANNPERAIGAWFGLTYTFCRFLWQQNAALLQKGGRFQTNILNPGGPFYDLRDR